MKISAVGRPLVGSVVAAGGLLGAVLVPLAVSAVAQADGVISCIVGEGCTTIPAPIDPTPTSPPDPSGPPHLISCIIDIGCTNTPVPVEPTPIGSGPIGSPDPFGWLSQDLSYLDNLFNTFFEDLFKL